MEWASFENISHFEAPSPAFIKLTLFYLMGYKNTSTIILSIPEERLSSPNPTFFKEIYIIAWKKERKSRKKYEFEIFRENVGNILFLSTENLKHADTNSHTC